MSKNSNRKKWLKSLSNQDENYVILYKIYAERSKAILDKMLNQVNSCAKANRGEASAFCLFSKMQQEKWPEQRFFPQYQQGCHHILSQ